MVIITNGTSEEPKGKEVEVETGESPIKTATIEEFESIAGVGVEKAESLYEAGYRSIGDIREATQEELSDVNHIGTALAARIKADVGNPQVEQKEEVEAFASEEPIDEMAFDTSGYNFEFKRKIEGCDCPACSSEDEEEIEDEPLSIGVGDVISDMSFEITTDAEFDDGDFGTISVEDVELSFGESGDERPEFVTEGTIFAGDV